VDTANSSYYQLSISPKKEPSKLVSIVLATYNGEKYLASQLESLFQQTYSNIEIIAIDDCSSDKTVEILQEHAKRHDNMKVFVNDVNLGFVKNFDKGCSLSKGDLIALCDQDDYWHCDKIKKMAEAIGDAPMIYCDSFVCDQKLQETGKKVSDIVNCQLFDNCLQQAIFCRIYGHATLFKKNLYECAHPFLKVIPHDWWLSYLATLHGVIKYLPEPLVFYRQHSSNLFGVVGVKRNKNKQESKTEKNRLKKNKIRARIKAFYNACPDHLIKEKKVLLTLVKSYESFSLINNFRRLIVFLRYRNTLLIVKKHSSLHRFFFCFKMFVKIK